MPDSGAVELDSPETVHWYLHGAEQFIELLHKEMLKQWCGQLGLYFTVNFKY